ncbi:hypothetical protein [Paraburkholderia sp. BL21I4N1]|uniref:hypothetical protein n=1 Tax=Paraburkholderia sp. BL21I4N1 TaxID=1938801 RepID=UPI000CFB833E|nr:hypothetical protein [Paraburkholderia sp. BL21I4N1]PQV53405.1 hypothetical protein B0G83_102491 [Paraburkholderia sp. BL21I4N1]
MKRVFLLGWLIAMAALLNVAHAETALPCGSGSTTTGKSYSVNGQNILLLAAPKAGAAKLVNEKATSIMHTTQYMAIDNSVTVNEQCTQGPWSRVQVTDPDFLSVTHIGWVPSSALRKPQVDASGQRVFTEADFQFDKATLPYKKVIIDGVNRIHRENDRCSDIDPSSAYLSSNSTQANPTFYVTCGKGTQVFNVFFTPRDVASGKKFEAPRNVDHTQAVAMCEAYAKSHATHPSTVDFSRVLDVAVSDGANGNTRVTSTFTAKNGYNLKLKYNIACLVNTSGLIEATISEAK